MTQVHTTQTTAAPAGGTRTNARNRRRPRPVRVALHVFLAAVAVVWLAPILYTLYTSLRPYETTGGSERGYWSLPQTLTFDNFTVAWEQAELFRYFRNTLIITVPALIFTLFLASLAANVIARRFGKLNIALLLIFTAGNLLPPQVIITPLFRMFLAIPVPEWLSGSGLLYDSYLGLIVIHVAFQVGFCVFVLSNYMRTLPDELYEAARVDGASIWRQYWQITLPLCAPPLAALGTLQFAWIYNDYFWALILIQTGDSRPITSALSGLQGQYFTDNNLVAAATLLAAAPTLLVFFVLRRLFVSGLTLGATKG